MYTVHAMISVIIPVFNAEKWLEECLQSVYEQDYIGTWEVSIYNDGSTDTSLEILEKWQKPLEELGVNCIIGGHVSDSPRGVGYAKNQAVHQSHGSYLCFLDGDDVMSPDRISQQFQAAVAHPNTIIGSKFHRHPEGSTERYTRWANNLSSHQLYSQIYTSHGPTVLMPTWFCSRGVFDKVGGFDESGKGVPEDLIFFFRHLDLGGHVYRVDRDLLMYRYHQQATTFSVLESTIWKVRMEQIQKNVINVWQTFTIWNAGKQGKKFYKSLTAQNQKKVKAFCDVDIKKIQRGYYEHYESKEKPKPRIPIVSYKDADGPFIICVKLDMSGGVLEELIQSFHLQEGKDYFHFN